MSGGIINLKVCYVCLQNHMRAKVIFCLTLISWVDLLTLFLAPERAREGVIPREWVFRICLNLVWPHVDEYKRVKKRHGKGYTEDERQADAWEDL